ncbi:uncharacterized protein LOC123319310 [Coccinella septempunctata]|uniref:uncharacterized protein LOC123319310 n=1 Tax=Coccinella septempunctata TaxID=41139 RepID=UPI001D073B4C|nr:uncharacterized protein LOC123319310 [Coccinella septempunctata]
MRRKQVALLMLALCFNNICPLQSLHGDSDYQHFCGTRLVFALSLICETYNTASEVYTDSTPRFGIVETCCKRPCSRKVLSSYCGTLKTDTKQSTQNQGEINTKAKKRNRQKKKLKRYNKSIEMCTKKVHNKKRQRKNGRKYRIKKGCSKQNSSMVRSIR